MSFNIREDHESGNALFYILIGAALFAALGFAISQSSSGSSMALAKERSNIAAAEILEISSIMSLAVDQTILRDFTESELDFINDEVEGYDNPDCLDGDYCELFGAAGGGLVYSAPSSDWLENKYSSSIGFGEWVFSGGNSVAEAGNDSVADLVVFLPYLKEHVCKAINSKLGLDYAFSTPPQETGSVYSYSNKFTGTFVNGGDLSLPYPYKGQLAGCFEGGDSPATGSYHFFQVLLAR